MRLLILGVLLFGWGGWIAQRSSGLPVLQVQAVPLTEAGKEHAACWLMVWPITEVFRSPFFEVTAEAVFPPPGIPHRVRFRYREEVPGGPVASLVFRKAPGIEPGEVHDWGFSVETGFQVLHLAPRCPDNVFVAGRDGDETVIEHWRIRPAVGMPSATAPLGRPALRGRVVGGVYWRPEDRELPVVERQELLRVPYELDGLVADPGGEYLLMLVHELGGLYSLDLASSDPKMQVLATAAEYPELGVSGQLQAFQTPWGGRGYRVLCPGGSLVWEGEGRGASRVRFAGRWNREGFTARYPRAEWLTHRVETAWSFVW